MRAAAESDLGALVALLRACDEVDVGSVESTEDDVRWRWLAPEFSLERDTFVIEEGGAPIGYGVVFEGDSDVWVHPSARGRGLGATLLDAIERRAAEQGSPDGMLRQNPSSRDGAALELLGARGYSESHHYARMELSLEGDGAPAGSGAPEVPLEVPDGITIANLEPGDERDVYDAYVSAWAQYAPSWREEGFERWSVVFEEGDFDPSLWFLARRAGRIVAFNQNFAYEGLGWIQMLGTIPSERGSGLGSLLLRNALAAFRARGLARSGLTVSSRNVPEARRLYERHGFVETLRYVNMARPLEGS